MIFFKKLLLLFFSYFFFSCFANCISFEQGIQSKLYSTNSNSAVYVLKESPIDHSKVPEANKIEIEESLVKKILLNIRREKSVLKPFGKDSLWDFETLDIIVPTIQNLTNINNEGKTFFLIVKEDDYISQYSRIFRTTLYINRNGNLVNMIFGEIKTNINFGSQFKFEDWANPSFFKIKCEKNENLLFEGKLKSAFQFKEDSTCKDLPKLTEPNRNNLKNHNWVQIDLKKVVELGLTKEKKKKDEIQEKRESRLKELMNLYNQGLINKEDYELKKAEVLGEL